jgi:hypothetical protein
MSNKRITDLTELTTPTTDDVFPVVDIATNTTTKVQLGNLPTTTAVTTALATKQDTLVSGTNIKTVNSTSLLGSGNVAVQPTLVSGTNIKTLNSTSLLGSGDIVLTANPSGVAGAIQFSNGSAFASDASNLFWDDTNNRLGIGTNAPSVPFEVLGNALVNASGTNDATLSIGNPNRRWDVKSLQSGAYYQLVYQSTGVIGQSIDYLGNVAFGNVATLGARVGIKGSGSTSATTSLLVQNSAGTEAFRVKDDLSSTFGGTLFGVNGVFNANVNFVNVLYGTNFWSQADGGTKLGAASAPVASAILEMVSTTRGFLPPRMTTTQKNAIATPAAGLVVYDSTTNKLCCYNGSTWNDLF